MREEAKQNNDHAKRQNISGDDINREPNDIHI